MVSAEKIRIVNGYDKNAYTYIPIVIVGAGESGIAMGCQLKQQLGFDQFRIFDRQEGLGGTWWINRYPGVACDIPAILYAFSFRPFREATEMYPKGFEIIRYFQKVASEFGIIDKISLNTEVSELKWLEDEKLWHVKVRYLHKGRGDLGGKERIRLAEKEGWSSVYAGEEIFRARVAISACGGLVEPNEIPTNIPGWENFKGDVFHTARWPRDYDFNGKDVVVVGSGCSAIQTVPYIIREPYNAGSVTQLMRTAPWLAPKAPEIGGKKFYKAYSETLHTYIPGYSKMVRYIAAAEAERAWFMIFGDKPFHWRNRKRMEKQLTDRMKKIAPKHYHDILTPGFSVGCKRRIFDREWYDSLNDPKVRLTTQKLTRVNENGVHLAGGGVFPERKDDPTGATPVDVKADVIVLANGFAVTEWLHPLKVTGKNNADLHEVWTSRGGAQAYMGNTIDGFPNFFIIFGPNTATGHTSVISTTENMVNYTLKFVKQILDGDAETVEVKKWAEVEWTSKIQRQLNDTVFHKGGCISWYFEQSGWNATVYPRSQWDYQLRCMFPRWSHFDIVRTTKGTVKLWMSRLIRTALLLVLIVGYQKLQASGIPLRLLPSMLLMSAKIGAATLLGSLVEKAELLQERILS